MSTIRLATYYEASERNKSIVLPIHPTENRLETVLFPRAFDASVMIGRIGLDEVCITREDRNGQQFMTG